MTTNQLASQEAVEVRSKTTYWNKISDEAICRIEKLFNDSELSIKDIVGNDGIQCYKDAKDVLAYVLCHAETSNERACAILSVCEWLHATNELNKGRYMDGEKI